MAKSQPRPRRLQICASNQIARRPDVLKGIRAIGCVVEIEECLDQCTRCESCAFALVGGRFLFAASPEEFLRKLESLS